MTIKPKSNRFRQVVGHSLPQQFISIEGEDNDFTIISGF